MRTLLFWAGDALVTFTVLGVHEVWIKPWAMRFVQRLNRRIRKAAPEVFKRIDPILGYLLLTKSGDELDAIVRETFTEVVPEVDWSQEDLTLFYELLDVRKAAGTSQGEVAPEFLPLLGSDVRLD